MSFIESFFYDCAASWVETIYSPLSGEVSRWLKVSSGGHFSGLLKDGGFCEKIFNCLIPVAGILLIIYMFTSLIDKVTKELASTQVAIKFFMELLIASMILLHGYDLVISFASVGDVVMKFIQEQNTDTDGLLTQACKKYGVLAYKTTVDNYISSLYAEEFGSGSTNVTLQLEKLRDNKIINDDDYYILKGSVGTGKALDGFYIFPTYWEIEDIDDKIGTTHTALTNNGMYPLFIQWDTYGHWENGEWKGDYADWEAVSEDFPHGKYFMELLLMWIIALATQMFAIAAAAGRLIQLAIYICLSPIAIVNVFGEGMHSQGIRFFKKLFACSLQAPAISIVLYLSAALSLSSEVTGFAYCALQLATIMALFKTSSMANDIVL